MNFLVTNTSIHYHQNFQSEKQMTIVFEAINDSKRHKLCIGDKYIFTTDGFDNENRKEVSCRISLIPCKDFKQSLLKNSFSEGSIGKGYFISESKDDFGLHHTPCYLWFDVYIESILFSEIKANLGYQNKSININLDIDGLSWGSEPDNSHQIWTMSPLTNELSNMHLSPEHLTILDFNISFNQ